MYLFTIHFIFRVILVKLKFWTQWVFVLFFAKVDSKLLGMVLVQVVPKVAWMIMYFGVLEICKIHSNFSWIHHFPILNQSIFFWRCNSDLKCKVIVDSVDVTTILLIVSLVTLCILAAALICVIYYFRCKKSRLPDQYVFWMYFVCILYHINIQLHFSVNGLIKRLLMLFWIKRH